jgi:F0F1-type ATP synthase assembly protein I
VTEKPTPPEDYERPVLPFEREPEGGASWGRWAGVGLEFGAAVVLFFLGGKALDATFSTTPWLALLGSLVGVAVGTYLLVRTALRAESRGSAGAGRNRKDGDA